MRQKTEIQSRHNLKILPEYFQAIAKGIKTFEIRKNDRNYQIGDQITLMEHNGRNYTGREIIGSITYITDYEQKEGYIVFGFRKWSINTQRQQRPDY
jgi:hypothetical protein